MVDVVRLLFIEHYATSIAAVELGGKEILNILGSPTARGVSLTGAANMT
jgi:hypothetical protein